MGGESLDDKNDLYTSGTVYFVPEPRTVESRVSNEPRLKECEKPVV